MYRSESCSRDAGRSILLVMACGLDLVGQNVRLDDGRSYVGDIGPEEETRLEPIKNVHDGKLISREPKRVGEEDDDRREEAAASVYLCRVISPFSPPLPGSWPVSLAQPLFRQGGRSPENLINSLAINCCTCATYYFHVSFLPLFAGDHSSWRFRYRSAMY